MLVAQSAARYSQLRYLCEIGHFTQDLLPFIRDASVQYEPYNLSSDICEVLCRESYIAESKYITVRVCGYSGASAVELT
jgi:hypothetical protein